MEYLTSWAQELLVDMLNLAWYFSISFFFLCPSLDLSTSKDAADDQFQRTLDVLSSTTMGWLMSWAQELLINILNPLPHIIFWSISITLPLIRLFTFKGSIWRPFPAHPWCPDWHNGGVVECARSRAFDWYAELLINLSNWSFISSYACISSKFRVHADKKPTTAKILSLQMRGWCIMVQRPILM